MARGNSIIVSANPPENFTEGYIAAGQTPKPGQVLQIDPTVALKGGRHTWKIYNRGADGKRPAGPIGVLLEDAKIGRTVSDAYAAGEFAPIHIPRAGEELNMLLGDVAGTADDHLAGEVLMIDDTTGKLVATTGSPQTESFILMEAVVDPVADTLVWVQYSGY